jgi:hypothetical protein
MGLVLVIGWTASPCGSRAEGNAHHEQSHGRALPFKVIRAIRNHGFKDGIVVADVSVTVDGGTPADWMATAVYVAEHSIIKDATVAEVLVIVPNGGADFPPLLVKELAKAYYDPNKLIWEKPWGIFVADHAASPADIEYFELGDQLLDPNINDPDKRQRKADAEARARVIRKYHLPLNWKSAADRVGYFGFNGVEYARADIDIVTPAADLKDSMSELGGCLTQNRNGNHLFEGC